LPAGLVVATPNGLTGSCGGGVITAAAGSGSITLAGATLAANASCNFAVNVTSGTAAVYNNTTGTVTSTNGGMGGTASATLTVTVAPPDFTLASSATAANPAQVHAGAKVTITINVTGTNGFAGTILLACDAAGIPPRAECLFPNGNSVTVPASDHLDFQLATVGNGSFLAFDAGRMRSLYTIWLPFPTLLIAGLCVTGRKRGGRKLALWIFGGLMMTMLLVLSGCGGKPGFAGTPPGTYTMTMTGTSGGTQHQVPVVVQVLP